MDIVTFAQLNHAFIGMSTFALAVVMFLFAASLFGFWRQTRANDAYAVAVETRYQASQALLRLYHDECQALRRQCVGTRATVSYFVP